MSLQSAGLRQSGTFEEERGKRKEERGKGYFRTKCVLLGYKKGLDNPHGLRQSGTFFILCAVLGF